MDEQKEMGLLGNVKRDLEYAPMELVEQCRDEIHAIQLCVQLSGLPHQTVYHELDIDKGHWTRIMQRQANFPDRKRNRLMRLCGNAAPIQYDLYEQGLPQLHEDERQKAIREARRQREEANRRLEELEGQETAA